MTLFKTSMLAAASFATLGLGLTATAQDSEDVPKLRKMNDECAFLACGLADATTAEEIGAILSDAADARAAAMAERELLEGTQYNQRGRGLKQGQQNNSPQTVWLKFGSDIPTFDVTGFSVFPSGSFPDYIFTQEDKDLIQARMEADYEGYNFTFVQEQPTQGDFTTIRIGDNDANPINLLGGILFGRADNIDFGNEDRTDAAFADASLWQYLAEASLITGIPLLEINLGVAPAASPEEFEALRRMAVVNQSANTSSHELGHIQGLRHHDAWGAPGSGLPAARNPGEFFPVGEVDQNAAETLLHIMASGASAGLSLSSPVFVDRFFGERSATKLAINERTRLISEDQARGKFTLNKVKGINPLESGENAGGKLDIRAGLIFGEIEEVDEVDSYSFKAKAGEVLNAEIISWTDRNVAEPVITFLTLTKDGVVVSENQITFEGPDPLIFDLELPESGEYTLEVASPRFYGGTFDLDTFAGGQFRTGTYNLLAYIVDGK